MQRVHQRGLHGLLVLGLRAEMLVLHQLEHDVALLLRLLPVLRNRRIVLRRVLCDHRDRRRLHDVELVGGRIEIPLRRGLHAIQRIRAELRDVQVALQNLLFRILLLHLHRDQHLAHLARDRVLGRMVFGDRIVLLARLRGEHVLHILLRERGAALLIALLHICLHERTQHALHIDARMLPEAAVLTRHHGLHHRLGDVLQRHDLTILRIELRDHGLAVARVHRRLLRQIRHVEIDALNLHRRRHGLHNLIRPHHGGQEEHGQRHAAAKAQRDEGKCERKYTSASEVLLLRHVSILWVWLYRSANFTVCSKNIQTNASLLSDDTQIGISTARNRMPTAGNGG